MTVILSSKSESSWPLSLRGVAGVDAACFGEHCDVVTVESSVASGARVVGVATLAEVSWADIASLPLNG